MPILDRLLYASCGLGVAFAAIAAITSTELYSFLGVSTVFVMGMAFAFMISTILVEPGRYE